MFRLFFCFFVFVLFIQPVLGKKQQAGQLWTDGKYKNVVFAFIGFDI